MGGTASKLMTPEEFFTWQLGQEDLYELVEGNPVKMLKMMTGASFRHDLMVVNVITLLRSQLRDGPCRPTTADIGIRTKIKSLRRADVMVECDPTIDAGHEARAPKLVVEVLSPSTTNIDQFRKLEEYKAHPSLAYILLIDTVVPKAALYARSDTGRDVTDFEGLHGEIALPAIGAALAMADIFEGLPFA